MGRIASIAALLAALASLAAAGTAAAAAQPRLDGAVALAAGGARAAGAAPCARGARPEAPRAVQEEAMLCLVNRARERRGLAPLSRAHELEASARDKAADLLRCDEFSHTACGRPFSHWIRERGYTAAPCWRIGENLAWGVDGERGVRAIFAAWMRSPSHRANILGPYQSTGLRLRVGSLGGMQRVHLWVQHFGSRCPAG